MVAMSRRLIHYDAARHELEVAATVDEVKEIHDQSEALRTYGRQIHDAELEAWSAEIKLRARARIGELSEGLERTDEATRLIGPAKHGNPHADAHGKHAILRQAGISSQVANRCEQVHRIFERDAEKVEAFIARKRAKKEPVTERQVLQAVGSEIVREDRVEKSHRRAEAFPDKRYGIILADPPWRYDIPPSDNRKIENQYPTMALEEIMALPVGTLAAPDAALFLWAALLEEGFEVLKAWGFKFRSHAVWVKPSVGMGKWFRQQHEMLLLGVRGNVPVPLAANRSPSVIFAPRGKHSEKPDATYEIIERGFPEFSKIELFARRRRNGWDRWGFEAPLNMAEAAE